MSNCSPVETLKTLRRFNGWFDGFTTASEGAQRPLAVNVSGYLRDESAHNAAGGNQLSTLGVPRSEEGFAGRVDKGDVRQIKANRSLHCLRDPPAVLQLPHPTAGQLSFEPEGHRTGIVMN